MRGVLALSRSTRRRVDGRHQRGQPLVAARGQASLMSPAVVHQALDLSASRHLDLVFGSRAVDDSYERSVGVALVNRLRSRLSSRGVTRSDVLGCSFSCSDAWTNRTRRTLSARASILDESVEAAALRIPATSVRSAGGATGLAHGQVVEGVDDGALPVRVGVHRAEQREQLGLDGEAAHALVAPHWSRECVSRWSREARRSTRGVEAALSATVAIGRSDAGAGVVVERASFPTGAPLHRSPQGILVRLSTYRPTRAKNSPCTLIGSGSPFLKTRNHRTAAERRTAGRGRTHRPDGIPCQTWIRRAYQNVARHLDPYATELAGNPTRGAASGESVRMSTVVLDTNQRVLRALANAGHRGENSGNLAGQPRGAKP
jgi:hypothetical protein